MSEAALSTSQEISQVVDTGEDSFAVDTTPTVEESQTSSHKVEKEVEQETLSEEENETQGDVVPAEEEKTDDLPKGVQKRIDTITRKRRDAEREAASLREENEALKRAATAQEAFTAKMKEPNEDDFETDEEYEEALIEYKVELAVTERDSQQSIKDREARRQEKSTSLQVKLDKVAGKYDDFDETITKVQVTSAMEDAIGEIPNSGEVAYYLGKNLNLVDEIAGMSPVASVWKIKEISDKLLTKKTTKAPTPLRTVTSTGGDIKSLENMPMAEYNKVRDKQDRERAGRY